MEKTALQQLIEHMETSMFSDDPIFQHAKSLLEVEREQIKEAYQAGSDMMQDFELNDGLFDLPINYYNSKYGGEDV